MKKLPTLLGAALALTFGLLAQTWTLPPPNPEPYVLLAWDPPNPSVTPAFLIDHYNIYWGATSGTYTNRIPVAGLSCGITQFVRGQTYFFAATTVTTNTLESTNFSNEVSWRPDTAPASPKITLVIGGR